MANITVSFRIKLPGVKWQDTPVADRYVFPCGGARARAIAHAALLARESGLSVGYHIDGQKKGHVIHPK